MSAPAHGARLALAGLVALASAVPADHGPRQPIDTALAGWALGGYTLVDQRGERFGPDALSGRWTFLLLGDRRCATPCSEALSALAGLYRRIAATRALETTRVVFISLDPEDTPERLAGYLAPYDPRFVGVTGPRQALDAIAQELDAPAAPSSAPGSPTEAGGRVAGSLWLVGPDQVIRARLLPPYDVPLLTAEYLKTRARR